MEVGKISKMFRHNQLNCLYHVFNVFVNSYLEIQFASYYLMSMSASSEIYQREEILERRGYL